MEEKLIIEQKRGRQLRKYHILDDQVKAEIKTDNSYQSFAFKFDDIEFDEMVVDRKPNPVEIGLFISIFFNIIFTVLLISDWAKKNANWDSSNLFSINGGAKWNEYLGLQSI